MQPRIKAFFDETTNTISYVVSEPEGKHSAIIDSVLDFDQKSGRTSTLSADEIVAYVRQNSLVVDWIVETHAHADHMTAAPYLKECVGGRIAIGEHVTAVQETFGKLFNAGPDFATDGSQFDHLFKDKERFDIGPMAGEIMHSPGHTPACVAYVVGDAVFAGDTIFMPDFGTARTDFPGGDAATLYRSIRRLLSLPPETRMFMCHDYAPNGRQYLWETTVAEQRRNNIHVRDGIGESEFVKTRTERDATIELPKLILPSVQVNMRAGRFPSPDENGVSYLKLPLNVL